MPTRQKQSPKNNGGGLSLASTVRARVPVAAREFERAKRLILGARYDLSLVFVGERRSRTLNRQYRGIDRATNVLSFALAPDEGEVLINLPRATREAERLGVAPRRHMLFLFIHACLHLDGYAHGDRMEEEEKRVMRVLGFSD